MITKENLLEVQMIMEETAKPLLEAYEKAKKEMDEEGAKLEKPFHNMLEQYYDEQLIDKNGVPIKIGDDITDGKIKLRVVKRGMQFAFNRMLFNPRIVCKKVLQDNTTNRSQQAERNIYPIDLIKWERIS